MGVARLALGVIHASWMSLGMMTAAAGCRPASPAPTDRPNILLITIDTIRADHLGCYGYFRDTSPHIDTLARESILFERCYAPISTTLPSHLSMMTGLYPLEHGTVANAMTGGGQFVPSPNLVYLADVLQRSGYTNAAFVSATPLKRFTGMAKGFGVFDEPKGSRRIAGATNEAVLQWLAEHPPEPFFLWIHYYDPHSPYRAPPPFEGRFRSEGALDHYLAERRFFSRPRGKLGMGPSADLSYARQMVNTYDGEIAYTDDQLHKILEKFRELGIWNRTITAVIGDHGEGLTQHGVHAHGHVWEEQVHVPFLIHRPGEAPRRISRVASVVDLAPTLLGLLRLPESDALLRQATGRDLLAEGATEDPLLSISYPLSQAHACTASIGGKLWKYMVSTKTGEAQLFCLSTDPYELNPLAGQNPAVEARMSEWLGELRARQEANAIRFQGSQETITPAIASELKELGYVGTDEAEPE